MTWASLRGRIPIDAKQEVIATFPADCCQLVLAPPGTGKTQIVVARLVHLICSQGIAPDEIAVLCFTRAAVSEITGRVIELVENADVHDDLRFITVRTFDSFATRLLLACNPDLELEDNGYDQRILQAVEALEDEQGVESRAVRRIQHLIVDELQDLVGVRARLVQMLLSRIGGGFTLLGDPAQGIYGWSVAGDANALTADALLNWIRAQTWSAGLVEPTIGVNYRSDGVSARIAQDLREPLISPDAAGSELLRRLKDVVGSLESAGTAIRPDGVLTEAAEGSLCVLCRSNGEVMQVASLMALQGVTASERPNPEDRGHPPWLGRVLGTYLPGSISFARFLERWDQLVGPDRGPGGEQAWKWLKYLEGEPAHGLNVRLLHRRLLAGYRLPDAADAFLTPGSRGVSVATIHSSKGREFDHVIVLEPSESKAEDTAPMLEEARVLYVATTRARESLRSLGRAGLPILKPIKVAAGRRRWLARSPRAMYFLEVGLAGDWDPCSGVSTWNHDSDDEACKAQELIWSDVGPGTPVMLRRRDKGRNPFFMAHLDEPSESNAPLLGQMSLSFLKDLRLALNEVAGNTWKLPYRMRGIRVAAVVTEVLPMYPENVREPFLTSRFCLGLRLRGMGYLWRR